MSVAQMRSTLTLQREFDALGLDLRCLAEALDSHALPPPRAGPVEAVPLQMAARSDCRWAAVAAGHARAGLSSAEIW